jgi:hypothetical protein
MHGYFLVNDNLSVNYCCIYCNTILLLKFTLVYRQAAIVIDDANHVTKTWGAANSRVFDALAAGCLVITNSGFPLKALIVPTLQRGNRLDPPPYDFWRSMPQVIDSYGMPFCHDLKTEGDLNGYPAWERYKY